MTARIAPSLAEVKQYATNVPHSAEVISQSLYDHARYPSGGAIDFEFFSSPVGSGLSALASATLAIPKTFADTNMEAPKMLPKGVAHLVTSIQVNARRHAGTNAIAAYTSQADPSGSISNVGFADPFLEIRESAYLTLFVGSKVYLTDCGLWRFPMTANLRLDVSIHRNVAGGSSNAGKTTGDLQADFTGLYVVDPPIFIPPEQNFGVKIQYIPARATVSTGPLILGVFLDGYRYRYSQ